MQHKPEVSGKISVDKEDRMSLDEIVRLSPCRRLVPSVDPLPQLTAFKPAPISPPLAADTVRRFPPLFTLLS